MNKPTKRAPAVIRSTNNAFTGNYPGAGSVAQSFNKRYVPGSSNRAPGGFGADGGTIAGMGNRKPGAEKLG